VRFAPLALVLSAASAQVTTPLLGWLPEGTQIRAMNGLPAASTLGSVVNVGHALSNIAVSPSQNYVLANDAESGEVLQIVPGVSATTLDSPVNPDRIVVSPRGSSAGLWYSGAAQLEILSGLPAVPAIRHIDASLLNGLSAIAVSDDGQWIAAASSSGVYAWGPDGVPRQVYGGSDAGALAFYTGVHDFAIATSTQLLSISESGAEPASTVLYQNSFSPAGLATSFDNQELVLADQNGIIYSVNAATHTPLMLNCQCRPNGVFGLGSAVFRLTSSTVGAIKLVDAGAGAILAVPRRGPVRGDVRKIAPSARPAQAVGALPAIAISLNPTQPGYLQQPTMTVTASAAYASEIDGNVTLTFASSVVGTDDTIQFPNGTATVNFTIPAGSTQANFSGAPSITFSTGTVAGTITLIASITSPTPASSVATQTITNATAAPYISSVQLSKVSGGVNVVITGYSSPRDVTSASFTFSLTSNATITQNDIGVGVSPQFQAWFANTSTYATGSEFTLTVPFSVTGNPADMTGVTVFMLNSKGESSAVSSH